jgi:hypothetical protein
MDLDEIDFWARSLGEYNAAIQKQLDRERRQ